MASAEVTLERSIFIGLIFTSVLYGANVTLYFLSLRLLLQQPRMKKHRRFYIIYSTLLLVLLTISLATNIAFADLMWIDDANFPGGPLAFYAATSSAWYNTLGTATDVTAFALGDGLLLYRCFMFWRDRRWIVILPAVLYVSSIAMSIMAAIESALPGATIFQGLPTDFTIPWMALNVSFNIVVTLTIIARLLNTYWTVRKTLSPSFSTTYINVSATLVESAFPFSAAGIGYLISQVRNSNTAIAFSFVWGTFAVLSPQFIVYRVAKGVAWSKDTTFITTDHMDFAHNPESEFKSSRKRGNSSGMGGSTLADSSNVDLRLYEQRKE